MAPLTVGRREQKAFEQAEREGRGFQRGIWADQKREEPRWTSLNERGQQRAVELVLREFLLGREDVVVAGELGQRVDDAFQCHVAERVEVPLDGHDCEETGFDSVLVALVGDGEHQEGENAADGELQPVTAAAKSRGHDFSARNHRALREAVAGNTVSEVEHELRAVQTVGVEVAVRVLVAQQLDQRACDFFADEFWFVRRARPLKQTLFDKSDVANSCVFVIWRTLGIRCFVWREM